MIQITREAAQKLRHFIMHLGNIPYADLVQVKEYSDLLTVAIDAPEQEPAWFACDTEGAEFDITFVTTREEAAMMVECALADDPDLKFEDLVTPLYTAPPAPPSRPPTEPKSC